MENKKNFFIFLKTIDFFNKLCYNNNCQEGIHPEDDTETKVDNGRTETRQRKDNPKNF